MVANGVAMFGGLFQITATTQMFHIFIILITATIIQITAFYPRRVCIEDKLNTNNLDIYTAFSKTIENDNILNKRAEQFKILEYPLILIFIITGAIFLVSTSDMVSIFLSIELQSYGLYILSTLYRNSELATAGGLTYFLLGGLSSCFILLGISILYANSGTTSLDGIYVIGNVSDIINENINIIFSYKSNYINYGFVLISIGFLFKVSAAPFHFWAPDVYDAIPTIVTVFVAILAKISIFVFFLELVHYTTNSLNDLESNWSYSLLISSLFSLIIGTVVGLREYRIKRLLTYSTISHIGFILLALSINTIESIQAFIFYLIQYSLTNLNVFIIIIAIGYSLFYYVRDNKSGKLKEKNNSPIQLVNQLKGFFELNPLLALSLTITIFSFAGIPPLLGFFGKLMILSASLDSGYIFLTLVAILTSVISAVYYLNIIKKMFFYKSEYKIYLQIFFDKNDKINKDINIYVQTLKEISLKIRSISNYIKRNDMETASLYDNNIILSSYLSITTSILTLIIMFFIFIPSESIDITNILGLVIFNT